MNLRKIICMSLSLILTGAMLTGCSGETPSGDGSSSAGENPVATIVVEDYGTMVVELYPDKAPNTVANFIALANDGFYDGLTFHRVSPGFVIQGGDPAGNGTGGPGYAIKGEFSENGYTDNDLKHEKGIISMARAMAPDSAGSQFFLMLEESSYLDGKYAAFGKLIEGEDVLDAIGNCELIAQETPADPPVITSITVDTKGVTYDAPETIAE